MKPILICGDQPDETVTNALAGLEYKSVIPAELKNVLSDNDLSVFVANRVFADTWMEMASALVDTGTELPTLHIFDGDPDAEEIARLSDRDDFVCSTATSGEVTLRLRRLLGHAEAPSDVVRFGPLELNTATYQAYVGNHPLDLTYMEYELLKHFVLFPGRTHTRQHLLKTVWGYEYYGGARTVDVHVRRLRFKLGEEQASLIQTVRSVGYIFGRDPDSAVD